jgi:tetratricopeptide (TPR) repeat protein
MSKRVIAGLAALLFGCGTGFCQSPSEGRCSVSIFESSTDDAIEACTAALSRGELADAARAEALKIRGRALHKAGRLDDAITDFEAALQLAPGDAELHLRRGWTAYDKRDLDLVFDHARQALRLKPEYAGAFDLIGAALAVSGEERFAEAKAAYDQAIRLDPAEPLPRYHRYQLLTRSYPREALQEVEALLQLPAAAITKPAVVDYSRKRTTFRIAGSLARALLLTTLGRLDEAGRVYDRAVHDDPDALTYAWRATFNLSQSAAEDVVQKDLDQALALDPDFWFARDQQARVHFYSERYDAAAAEFARALQQFPDNGTVHWWRAMTLRKLGRTEEASVEAVNAFEVDPGFMFSKVHMLQARGYLPALAPNADPMPALDDAARACMLDQECS